MLWRWGYKIRVSNSKEKTIDNRVSMREVGDGANRMRNDKKDKSNKL